MNIAGPSVRTVQRLTLTDRQKMILDFIADNLKTRGFPPTLREIGEAFHIRSTNGVNDHLRALERKGFIVRDEMRARGIRVVGMSTGEAIPTEVMAPPSPVRIVVDRMALATALAELESIADWVPGPIADKYEEALAEIKAQLLRAIPAPASTPEVAA